MLLFGHDIRDTIRIDEQGRVGVFKLDNWVERTTNDVVNLHGAQRTQKTIEGKAKMNISVDVVSVSRFCHSARSDELWYN